MKDDAWRQGGCGYDSIQANEYINTFTQGSPNQFGGGFTEVRTIEVTIRELR